jgi:hypothetical protein
MLIEKVRQRTFLYDTKSPDYRDQHMRANAWEGIGKELKIIRKFYVSSRDVRIVCPRLRRIACERNNTTCGLSQYVPGVNFTSIDRSVVTFRIDLWQTTRYF